ncbi:MAG: Thiol-disulfide oxidoreductase ResA [Candidatus Heimdallarchaeota archaeon LC_2]|nr:MAG: Thiol-disulfide oxidoreductase ResA [Candidatus Heimdallarchaeota archaeon LC_2]
MIMALELNSKPLDFRLKGVDDKLYSLSDFDNKKYLAIIFSCNHCPYVVASEREFVQLQDEYGSKGLQIVAINTNSANPNYPTDSFENMVKRAEEKNFNFPYLDDSDQSVSKDYGAGRTPEIYLFNENRNLIYHGRINDNPREHDKITRRDLKEALDELISGNEISLPINNALGCSIKWVES